jgi:hypothetical protein
MRDLVRARAISSFSAFRTLSALQEEEEGGGIMSLWMHSSITPQSDFVNLLCLVYCIPWMLGELFSGLNGGAYGGRGRRFPPFEEQRGGEEDEERKRERKQSAHPGSFRRAACSSRRKRGLEPIAPTPCDPRRPAPSSAASRGAARAGAGRLRRQRLSLAGGHRRTSPAASRWSSCAVLRTWPWLSGARCWGCPPGLPP